MGMQGIARVYGGGGRIVRPREVGWWWQDSGRVWGQGFAGNNGPWVTQGLTSMVRNVDSPSKFLMYPRFLQVLINNQVDNLSSYITRYTSPTLTKKVFANMRKVGKGFSGVETPLFAAMLVQPQAATEENDEEDEVSAAPTLPSPTHEPTLPPKEPITSSPQAQPDPPSSSPQEQPTDTS
nr:hypothetical protein [Tanacetum cinerariifolium]